MNYTKIFDWYDDRIKQISIMEGLPLLLLRVYLAPIFIQAGWTKYIAFENTSAWFGNAEWGLGLPLPDLMASLVIASEFIGGWLLLFGLLTRLTTIPLLFTMFMAALTAHWQNGWLALSDASSWFADGTIMHSDRIMAGVEKKQKVIEILRENGHYEWLTSSGPITILNNGIEFAATYFVMLLVLLFAGAGRFVSLDYYLKKIIRGRINK